MGDGATSQARQIREKPRASTAVLAFAMLVGPAHAACPMALAIYEDRDKVATIDFRPNDGGAAVTNAFALSMRDTDGRTARFDGIVMWSTAPSRPNGILMHRCPEGDVTGQELAACTLWQGVVYTVDDAGNIGLLPESGDAPKRLLLADLGPQMAQSPAFAKVGLAATPWDVFEFSGCQE